MNKEHTLKLVKRFPVLYQGFYDSMQETCMCWGFEVGDGWEPILWQLSLAIEEELGYTRFQKWLFLFKKKWAKRWNNLIYRLSPVVRNEYRRVGKGTKEEPFRQEMVKKVYPRDQWLKDFLLRIFPDKTNFPKPNNYFERLLGNWQSLGFKALVWHPNTGFKVDQVKEKFAILRYYCPTNDRIDKFIAMAESLSEITCETCGKSGKLRSEGWMVTACDECYGKPKTGQ